MKARMLLGLCVLSVTPLAQAENAYAGFGINAWNVDFDGGAANERFSPLGFDFNYGYQFHDYFAFEARAGFGVADDAGVELARYGGLNLKGMLHVTRRIHPYAMLGYSTATFDLSGSNRTYSGASFAAGVDVIFSREWGFSAEYARLLDSRKDGIDAQVDGLRASLRYLY